MTATQTAVNRQTASQRGAAYLDALHAARSKPLDTRPRLPAYGRGFQAVRQRGEVPARPEVFVVLDTWHIAKHLQRVVIPDDLHPQAAVLGFVSGLDVWLLHDSRLTDRDRVADATRAILQANPNRLICFDVHTDRMTFIKSEAVGIELQEFCQ